MKIIKSSQGIECNNSTSCKVIEYSYEDKDIDLGIAEITGRYPEQGYCQNNVSKELVYVLEGKGVLYFQKNNISFSKGDSILIDKNEPYYWDSSYCQVALICTPAWTKEQHELIINSQ